MAAGWRSNRPCRLVCHWRRLAESVNAPCNWLTKRCRGVVAGLSCRVLRLSALIFQPCACCHCRGPDAVKLVCTAPILWLPLSENSASVATVGRRLILLSEKVPSHWPVCAVPAVNTLLSSLIWVSSFCRVISGLWALRCRLCSGESALMRRLATRRLRASGCQLKSASAVSLALVSQRSASASICRSGTAQVWFSKLSVPLLCQAMLPRRLLSALPPKVKGLSGACKSRLLSESLLKR